MKTYTWTEGAHIKTDAQRVGEVLVELQSENGGRLTPRVYVDAARPSESPLHPTLEWDNLRAAELYREDQARHVIRCIRVATPNEKGEQEQRRVFVNVIESVDGEDQNGYAPLARVLSSDDLRQQLIVQARRDLAAFKKRYAELADLVSVADAALEQIDALLPSAVAVPAA
jgi:hypothetical protein